MKKFFRLIFILLLGLCFLPISSYALDETYKDVLSDELDVKVEEGKINIYLFYGDGCPHCHDEMIFLDKLDDNYKDKINFYFYETWNDKDNANLMLEVKEFMGAKKNVSVPFLVIGDKYYSGYSEHVGISIEEQIRVYLELEEIKKDDTVVEKSKIKIPLIGEVNTEEMTISFIAIILGFIDGFNPCAMWILLFLINMLFGMKDRKKMFLLGFTFLFTSGVFYFLSMLGINVILGFISTNELRSLIGLVAIGFGIYNLYIYFRDRKKENGCQVVDEEKRKSIIKKVKNIKNASNIFLAFGGIILLAISVNMVELACSAGFPTIFSEILVQNNVTGVLRIVYLLLYVLFYMIDDMVVFTISICTLTITGVTTKYNKLVKIIGGILMLLMGILLIFKPEWIMLNF